MSNMDSRMKQDLDNYITGHYGEDQIEDEKDDIARCPDCEYPIEDCICDNIDDIDEDNDSD